MCTFLVPPVVHVLIVMKRLRQPVQGKSPTRQAVIVTDCFHLNLSGLVFTAKATWNDKVRIMKDKKTKQKAKQLPSGSAFNQLQQRRLIAKYMSLFKPCLCIKVTSGIHKSCMYALLSCMYALFLVPKCNLMNQEQNNNSTYCSKVHICTVCCS